MHADDRLGSFPHQAHGQEAESNPLVSVIVGAYNHERYVEQCLNSILSNCYANYEILVFNDASSDRTGICIERWIKQNPSVSISHIVHNQNLGLTRSLNEAVRKANGDFICWISADDLMLSNGIVDRVRYLENHSSKLAVFSDCIVIDAVGTRIFESGIEELNGRKGMRRELLQYDDLMLFNIVFHWAVPGPVFMCRPEIYDIVGLYDERLVIEDWDMYLRIAATGRLGFLDARVAEYRVHPQNTSMNVGARLDDDLAESARKNRWRIGGIGALYLSGIYYQKRARSARNKPSKMYWRVISKSLRVVAPRLYHAKRTMILRRLNTAIPVLDGGA